MAEDGRMTVADVVAKVLASDAVTEAIRKELRRTTGVMSVEVV